MQETTKDGLVDPEYAASQLTRTQLFEAQKILAENEEIFGQAAQVTAPVVLALAQVIATNLQTWMLRPDRTIETAPPEDFPGLTHRAPDAL